MNKHVTETQEMAPVNIVSDFPVGSPAQSFVSVLSQHVDADRVVFVDDLAKAANAARVLLPLALPQMAVANLLETGTPPDACLDAWKLQTKPLLKTIRKLRDRAVVMDVMALANHDPDSQAILLDASGIDLGQITEAEGIPLPSLHLQTIAAIFLAADPEATAMAEALETVVKGGQSGIRPESDVLFDQLAKRLTDSQDNALHERIAGLEAECMELRQSMMELQPAIEDGAARNAIAPTADLSEEIGLLRETLGQALSELDAAQQRHGELETQLHAQHDEMADHHMLQVVNASLENRIAEAQQEHIRREAVLGMAILNAVRPDGNQVQAPDLSTELLDARQEINALQDKLNQIMGSRSWRLTAPIRAAREHLGKRDED